MHLIVTVVVITSVKLVDLDGIEAFPGFPNHGA